MIYTNQQEIEFLFEMARKCSMVAGNPDYTRKASNTIITFDPSDTVNAYASTNKQLSNKITIFNGICATGHLCSFALPNKNPYELIEVCNYIGNIVIKNKGNFSYQDLETGIKALNLNTSESHLREVESYSAGYILAVIAHELGHIALSHTIHDRNDYGISRDMERQADLFACSVARSTPFSNYMIPGLLFGEIVFSWATQQNSIDDVTTHPHSPERVWNIFNSHEDTLSDYGITRNNLTDFLP